MIIKERENILCVDAAFSCSDSLLLEFCMYSARRWNAILNSTEYFRFNYQNGSVITEIKKIIIIVTQFAFTILLHGQSSVRDNFPHIGYVPQLICRI